MADETDSKDGWWRELVAGPRLLVTLLGELATPALAVAVFGLGWLYYDHAGFADAVRTLAMLMPLAAVLAAAVFAWKLGLLDRLLPGRREDSRDRARGQAPPARTLGQERDPVGPDQPQGGAS